MDRIQNILSIIKGDRVMWSVVAMLALISLLVIYSSTGALAHKLHDGNTEYLLIKHFVFLVMGGGVLFFCYTLDYMLYSKLGAIFLVISIFLLVYTMFFGVEINGASRWIRIPLTGLTFQTSDLAKISLIIYVARQISANQENIKALNVFLSIVVPVLIICGLIAPSDLSTAGLLFITCIILMWVGRISSKYIFYLLILGIALFGLLYLIGLVAPGVVRSETWTNRMLEFLSDSDGSYQIQQAKMSIARGEFFGVGPGNSFQRNYIPHPYSDFVYAFIVEEYGLIGSLIIIALYIVFLFRSLRLVTRSPKAFGSMLVMGLSLLLVIQALLNMAVSVELVPLTGLPMPLVSNGGTSLIFTCAALGIILCVSKYIELPSEQVEVAKEEENE